MYLYGYSVYTCFLLGYISHFDVLVEEVKSQVEGIKSVMALNTEKVLEKGEKLDSLEELTEELTSTAEAFKRRSHSSYRMKKVKHYYSCTNAFQLLKLQNCKIYSFIVVPRCCIVYDVIKVCYVGTCI